MTSIARLCGLGTICAAVTAGSGNLPAQEGKPDSRAAAVAFLRQHVIGKSVTCSLTNRIPAEAFETTFERRSSFTNLTETKAGFTFDEHYAVKQVIYDLDRDGKRVGEGRKADRWGLVRYQVFQRKSVDVLVGTARLEFGSDDANVGGADAVAIELAAGNLVVTATTIGVADHFAGKGKFKPGFAEIRTTYRVREGALYREQVEKGYNLDVKTGKKEPSGDPVTILDVPVK